MEGTPTPNFEGIQLFGSPGTGGALFVPRARPTASAVAHLDGGVIVLVREGVLGVVVRGISAQSYEEVMESAPELANRGLDIFALTGVANVTLADVHRTHVAWWGTSTRTIRVWSRLTASLGMSISGVVRDKNGEIVHAPEPATPKWQESMRYYRMSQVTDDLFDAFRNVFLALESILSAIEPVLVRPNGRSAESEKDWFKRALATVATRIDIAPFVKKPTGNAVHDIYDELHNEVRNRVFHAKEGLSALLPHELTSRSEVAAAHERFSNLYLAIVGDYLGVTLPTGGLMLSTAAARDSAEAVMLRSGAVGVTADVAPFDPADTSLSPADEPCAILPAVRFADPREAEGFLAVMASTPVAQLLEQVEAVGRIATLTPDGTPGLVESLEGRLALQGFDVCEFVFSFRLTGKPRRRSVYAT